MTHHYDVGNDFYKLVLGPSHDLLLRPLRRIPSMSLEQAQESKHELISRKLGLPRGGGQASVGRGLRVGHDGDACCDKLRRESSWASP